MLIFLLVVIAAVLLFGREATLGLLGLGAVVSVAGGVLFLVVALSVS